MTLNLPITYVRIHDILLVGEFFVQPIYYLFTSTEWSPSLKKQVHSYVVKVPVPIKNHLNHIKYACNGHSFYPEDDLINRKCLVS